MLLVQLSFYYLLEGWWHDLPRADILLQYTPCSGCGYDVTVHSAAILEYKAALVCMQCMQFRV